METSFLGHPISLVGWSIGRLVFNGTFSRNGLCHTMSAQEINPVLYLLCKQMSKPRFKLRSFHSKQVL